MSVLKVKMDTGILMEQKIGNTGTKNKTALTMSLPMLHFVLLVLSHSPSLLTSSSFMYYIRVIRRWSNTIPD